MPEDPSHYLDLIKRILVNSVYQDAAESTSWLTDTAYDPERRAVGQDWPTVAHTMVGRSRLDNAQESVERVLAEGVPGDLVETGVWRGGVCILMRAVLKVHGVTDRKVWAADSFTGIPDAGSDGHPLARKMGLHRFNDVLAVSVEDVKRTSAVVGCWTTRSSSCPVGSPTPCPPHRLTRSPYCASTATFTTPRWTP